ncbi:hypothetical protein ACCO45_012878 [Purpureocillium lilacinum]|uniref:Uncharacterized protein n=1 Tax=Purpureocillium lilacinum TaxID=33203 RepID=A0ACC4D994_PURLI
MLAVLKHSQQAQVVARLEGASSHKADPEEVPLCENARDERPQALRGSLDDVDGAHDGGALAGEQHGGEEGGARGDVHGLGAGAQDEEEERERQRRGHGDEGEEDGGGEKGEEEGYLDVAEALGERGGDNDGRGGDEARGEEDGAEAALVEVEARAKVVGDPGPNQHGGEARRKRVERKQEAQRGGDALALGAELRQHGRPPASRRVDLLRLGFFRRAVRQQRRRLLGRDIISSRSFPLGLLIGLDSRGQREREHQLHHPERRIRDKHGAIRIQQRPPQPRRRRLHRPPARHHPQRRARRPRQAIPRIHIGAILPGSQMRHDALLHGAERPNLIPAGANHAQHRRGEQHAVGPRRGGEDEPAGGHEARAEGQHGAPAQQAVGGEREQQGDEHVAGEGQRHEEPRLGARVAERAQERDEDERGGAVGGEADEALGDEELDVEGERARERRPSSERMRRDSVSRGGAGCASAGVGGSMAVVAFRPLRRVKAVSSAELRGRR